MLVYGYHIHSLLYNISPVPLRSCHMALFESFWTWWNLEQHCKRSITYKINLLRLNLRYMVVVFPHSSPRININYQADEFNKTSQLKQDIHLYWVPTSLIHSVVRNWDTLRQFVLGVCFGIFMNASLITVIDWHTGLWY